MRKVTEADAPSHITDEAEIRGWVQGWNDCAEERGEYEAESAHWQ